MNMDITELLSNLCKHSGHFFNKNNFSIKSGSGKDFYNNEYTYYSISIFNNGELLFKEIVSDVNPDVAKSKCEDRIMLSIFLSAMNQAEKSLKSNKQLK